MFKVNTEKALKIIILLSLINSSAFIAFRSDGYFRLITTLMMNISVIFLIIFFLKISKRKFGTNLYFKVMFFLLMGWSIFTIFHGLYFEAQSLITLFGHYLMGWAWVTPLAVVFGFNINNWVVLFDFFSTLLFVVSLLALEAFIYPLSISFGLLEWMAFFPVLLLTYFYQKKNHKKILLLSVVSYIILTFSTSQRANAVFLTVLILFFIFEYYRKSTRAGYRKFFIPLILLLGSIILVVQLDSLLIGLSENKQINTDTRTFLFVELFSDMSENELIVGRGALGTYYSPYFSYTEEHGLSGDSSTRSLSEVGYLEIILKGGFVMLVLYLLILLPAAYLGVFKSKNIIAKMSGYYISSYLALWLVSYYPVYSVEYLLLWMATGTAISSSARNVKNNDLLVKRRGHLEF